VTPNIYTWEYYIWNFRSWAGRPMLNGYPIAFPHLIDLLAKAKGKVAPGSPELARLELLEKEMAPVVAAVSGKFDLPQFVSTRLSVPPSIEGIYQSTWGPSAIRLVNDKGTPGDPATEIRVGHDSQNLYLSFEVARKPATPVAASTAKPAEPGTTKVPETLVITLQPKKEDKAVAKIIVNEDGLVSDALENHPDYKKAADWDSHAVVRTRFKAPGWTGELSIPWDGHVPNIGLPAPTKKRHSAACSNPFRAYSRRARKGCCPCPTPRPCTTS
jgi:hypothetical protein